MPFYIKKDPNEKQKTNLVYATFDEAVSRCPEGFSVFDLRGKCVYTKTEQDYTYEDEPQTSLIKYEHDKYKHIWEELKKNITNKINGLHNPSDSTNIANHLERVIEERELMRILMMMKSLENNEPIFKGE